MQCLFNKDGKTESRKYPFDNNISVKMNDEGAYIAECPEGHQVKVIVQNPKFEILFDLSLIAYIDGYNREAISNLTSSYERFLEYCIEILLLKRKTDLSNYSNTWKEMKNQSERQMGAFLILWLSEFNEVPPKISNKKVSFRNNVIHKGYIPSNEETIDYIQTIYNLIFPMMVVLKTKYDKEINDHTMYRLMNLNKKYSHIECPSSTMGMASALGLYTALSEFNKKEIEDLISQTKRSSRFMYKKFKDQEYKDNRYQLLEALYGRFL